jgi:hypothetical protein
MRAIVIDRPGSFRVTDESTSSFTPDSLLMVTTGLGALAAA